MQLIQASAITEKDKQISAKDKQISGLENDKAFHESTIKFLLEQNEQHRIENNLFVEKMMDRFEKMALMIAPHQHQNTGPTSSAFDGSFMQGSFFDDKLESFENLMTSSCNQTGFLLEVIKNQSVLFHICLFRNSNYRSSTDKGSSRKG